MEIKYRIKSISIEQFATVKDVNPTPDRSNTEFNFEGSLTDNNTIIKLKFGVIFKFDKDPFIYFTINQEFAIDLVDSKKTISKITEFPSPFLKHLAEITMHTARGILHCKLEETEYRNFILPLIDMSKVYSNTDGDQTSKMKKSKKRKQ